MRTSARCSVGLGSSTTVDTGLSSLVVRRSRGMLVARTLGVAVALVAADIWVVVGFGVAAGIGAVADTAVGVECKLARLNTG
jgi:hypothetical protein